MTVTSFRPHRRFAVRQTVRISHAASANTACAEGLLIELSIRGCRISNIDPSPFANGDAVYLEIEGFSPIHGSVRMADKGVLCLTFATPLYTPALDDLINQCRAPQPAPVWPMNRSMRA
jgi:hypothetical protein